MTTLHVVSDPSVVWYGGMGHKTLSNDGGIECYRCGMAADDSALQELVPDCLGPDGGLAHHWMAAGPDRIECAYGDYRIDRYGNAAGSTHCTRA